MGNTDYTNYLAEFYDCEFTILEEDREKIFKLLAMLGDKAENVLNLLELRKKEMDKNSPDLEFDLTKLTDDDYVLMSDGDVCEIELPIKPNSTVVSVLKRKTIHITFDENGVVDRYDTYIIKTMFDMTDGLCLEGEEENFWCDMGFHRSTCKVFIVGIIKNNIDNFREKSKYKNITARRYYD